jgi:hypothetical protein
LPDQFERLIDNVDVGYGCLFSGGTGVFLLHHVF